MTGKPVRHRIVATQDVEAAVRDYREVAGEKVSLAFVEALRDALRLIAAYPGAGSSRYAHRLAIPTLRCLRVQGFPYLVFYVEQSEMIDVWRVLHGHRDIPSHLTAEGDE